MPYDPNYSSDGVLEPYGNFEAVAIRIHQMARDTQRAVNARPWVIPTFLQKHLSMGDVCVHLDPDVHLDLHDREILMRAEHEKKLHADAVQIQREQNLRALGRAFEMSMYLDEDDEDSVVYDTIASRIAEADMPFPHEHVDLGAAAYALLITQREDINTCVKHEQELLIDHKPYDNVVTRLFCNTPEQAYSVNVASDLGELALGDDTDAIQRGAQILLERLAEQSPWLPVGPENLPDLERLVDEGPRQWTPTTSLDIVWRQRPADLILYPEQGVDFPRFMLMLRDRSGLEHSTMIIENPLRLHLRLPCKQLQTCFDKGDDPRFVILEDAMHPGTSIDDIAAELSVDDRCWLLRTMSLLAPRKVFLMSYFGRMTPYPLDFEGEYLPDPDHHPLAQKYRRAYQAAQDARQEAARLERLEDERKRSIHRGNRFWKFITNRI